MQFLALGGGTRGGPNLGWGFAIFLLVFFSSLAVSQRIKRRAEQRDERDATPPTDLPTSESGPLDP